MIDRVGRQIAGERYALACLVILMLVIVGGSWRFPEGYDATYSLVSLKVLAVLWAFGFAMRMAFPSAPFLYLFEATALSSAIGIQAALATASVAPSARPYADPLLAQVDSYLVPWLSWPELIDFLSTWPEFFEALNYIYLSLNYEGPLLLGVLALRGDVDLIKILVAAGGIAALIALPIFAFLPAQGAYVYYGYSPEDVPSLFLRLPFDFPAVLEGLRSGAIRTLSGDAISGLISFPSFHAAGATMLSLGWRKIRYARGPMWALNAGIAFSAIPIGSHYFCDVFAGVLLGVVAYFIAEYLIGSLRNPPLPDAVAECGNQGATPIQVR